MLTLQELKNKKKEMGYTNEMIAEKSGVPLGTVQKVFAGITKSPRRDTLLSLEKAFSENPMNNSAGSPVSYAGLIPVNDLVLREAAPAYGTKASAPYPGAPGDPKQGRYTVDDYLAIPEDQHVELIDGFIYDMGAPTPLHQKILGELHLQLRACTDAHESDCEVYLSPCDVQLDNDNKTMLQPDLFVICRDYDHTSRSIPGAPDLTVEILSPSSRSKDMMLKLHKYYNAGVREYWIIDPENKEVYVYDFTKEAFKPEVYTFEDYIPIHISGGACRVDFTKINKRIAPHYG